MEEGIEYRDEGDIPISKADDANIPVDIWLMQSDEDDEPDKKYKGLWRLTANNYMPRKSMLSGEGSYRAYAENREVLVKLVHRHWLPLYQTAVATLTEMKPDDRGVASLYYWDKKE